MGRGITLVRGGTRQSQLAARVVRSHCPQRSTARSCSRTSLLPPRLAVRRPTRRVACHHSRPATVFRLSRFTANSSQSDMICDLMADAKFTLPPFWRSCDGVIDLRVRIANQPATSGHVSHENFTGILLAQCCRYQTKETPVGGKNHVQSRQQTCRG